MGFFFRKRIKLLPGINLNLSKNGLGLSYGVKGFRISQNSRGTYLNAGANGFYYRKKLDSKTKNKNKTVEQQYKNNTEVISNKEIYKIMFIPVLWGLGFTFLFIIIGAFLNISQIAAIIGSIISFFIGYLKGLLSFNTKKTKKTAVKIIENPTKKIYDNELFENTVFWDELNVNLFQKNIECLKKWICPYCGITLPKCKGNSFKCPQCKNKIYKKREILTENEGLFTENDRNKIQNLWNEFQSRKSFLNIWEQASQLVSVDFSSDKSKNIEKLITALHFGKPEYYIKQGYKKLFNCRFLEGELQERYGTIQQATNAYMSCLFIDLMGDYNTLYDDSEIKKELLEDLRIEKQQIKKEIREQKEEIAYYKKLCKLHGEYFDESKYTYDTPKIDETLKEWMRTGKDIAPGIFRRAFQENLPFEEFEKIFKFNAESLIQSFNFECPITPDEAWNKILEYKKENETENQ